MIEAMALVVQLLLIGQVGLALVGVGLALVLGLVILGIAALLPWSID